MIVNVVVEGASDSGAASRLVEHAGHTVGKLVNKRGKGNLDPDIPKYAKAAEWEPWVVFRDSDSECPVQLRQRLMNSVAHSPNHFQLRIAHSMTEAWLLADHGGFASYFGINEASLPREVEDIPHAKREVLRLCSQSRSRAIREAVVTRDGEVGPLYVSTLNDFARSGWDVSAASDRSESLARAVTRISDFGE